MITLSKGSGRDGEAPAQTAANVAAALTIPAPAAAPGGPVPLTWNLSQATDRHLTQTTDWSLRQTTGRNLGKRRN